LNANFGKASLDVSVLEVRAKKEGKGVEAVRQLIDASSKFIPSRTQEGHSQLMFKLQAVGPDLAQLILQFENE
jgi:hypothetical protein